MIKRLISCMMILMLFCTGASAQNALTEGELTLESEITSQVLGDALCALLQKFSGDITVENGENGFVAQLGDYTLYGTQEENGLMLSLDGRQGVRLTGMNADLSGMLSAWLDAQGPETAQTNAVYSSLFTRSVSADVTGDMLVPVLAPLVQQLSPVLSMLGVDAAALQQAVNSVQPGAVWGRIARYKGDAQQYPDLSLMTLTLSVPGLPHVYLWLRSDEFGTTLRLGVEKGEVLDWDETLLMLEEGGSETGFVVNGFTLLFDDDEELNTYIEATIVLPDAVLTLECDHYLSYTDDYLWSVDLLLKEAVLGDIATLWLEAVPTDDAPDAARGLKEISLDEFFNTL